MRLPNVVTCWRTHQSIFEEKSEPLLSSLPYYIARILVFPQRDKFRMAEMIGWRPL
jgi:hypothetical protein